MSENQTNERKPLPLVPVTACPVCGETAHTLFRENVSVDMRFFCELPDAFKGQKFSFVQCPVCSLVYLTNRPANEDLEVYYNKGYAVNYKAAVLKSLACKMYDYIHYSRLKKQIHSIVDARDNDVNILDYGCGDAERINHFYSFNPKWTFHACDKFLFRIENSNDAVHTFESTYKDIPLYMDKNSCDAITAFDVIEHVESPVEMLQSFFPLLKPKGLVYLVFPSADCWEASLFDDLFMSFHVPCHFTMLSRQSIEWTANKTGFIVKHYGNEMLSASTLWNEIESSINKRFSLPNALLNVLRLPLAVSLLPLEMIQSWRGKSLSEHYAILQKR